MKFLPVSDRLESWLFPALNTKQFLPVTLVPLPWDSYNLCDTFLDSLYQPWYTRTIWTMSIVRGTINVPGGCCHYARIRQLASIKQKMFVSSFTFKFTFECIYFFLLLLKDRSSHLISSASQSFSWPCNTVPTEWSKVMQGWCLPCLCQPSQHRAHVLLDGRVERVEKWG